jgi:hypothetical protein
MGLLTYDREYDNVLLGQGYRISRGAVINQQGEMVELLLIGENIRDWRKTC